jgi:hypothetical protein
LISVPDSKTNLTLAIFVYVPPSVGWLAKAGRIALVVRRIRRSERDACRRSALGRPDS